VLNIPIDSIITNNKNINRNYKHWNKNVGRRNSGKKHSPEESYREKKYI